MSHGRGSRQRFLRAQKAVVIRKSYLKLVVIETTEKTQEAWERVSERAGVWGTPTPAAQSCKHVTQ